MTQEGPTLEHLLRRLAGTPSDFFAEPRTHSGRGTVHVTAVAADLLAWHGGGVPNVHVQSFTPDDSATSRQRAGVVLVLCWFLADEELIARKIPVSALPALLTNGAAELASQNTAAQYRDDAERREEFVRFALSRLDLRPAGETPTQAQDRLTALSSIERNRVIAASRAAVERALAIREALARKAAQEAADKYTRE